jgi:hypothetical protein
MWWLMAVALTLYYNLLEVSVSTETFTKTAVVIQSGWLAETQRNIRDLCKALIML